MPILGTINSRTRVVLDYIKQGYQKVCVHMMITIQKFTSSVQSIAADRQGQETTRHTLTPTVIPNSNYVIMVSDWNLKKIFLRVFCTVIIRCIKTFWSLCIFHIILLCDTNTTWLYRYSSAGIYGATLQNEVVSEAGQVQDLIGISKGSCKCRARYYKHVTLSQIYMETIRMCIVPLNCNLVLTYI
jgi:hypothetical protein